MNYETSPSKNREAPEFDSFEFFSKKHQFCIFVFVINEGEKLLRQLERMKPLADLIDIVVADGGSTDGSTENHRLKALNVNSLLVKRGGGKLGVQMRMAFNWCLERNYEGCLVVDGNNKDGVEGIPLFIEALKNGYDHIQGSRFISGGTHKNTPMLRLWGVRLLHAPLIRWASGFAYTDTTNGFRAYSAKLLDDPRMAIFRKIFVGYELHYYLAIRSAQLGFRCIEVPVNREYPDGGKVPTKISPIRGNIQVLQKLFAACLGLYNK